MIAKADAARRRLDGKAHHDVGGAERGAGEPRAAALQFVVPEGERGGELRIGQAGLHLLRHHADDRPQQAGRSEEHTSELQSLMRISYAVFCLKKKTTNI